MKEIKFRAWTNDTYINEGMLYDYQDTIYTEVFGFDQDELPLMQFTGKQDKNGRDVYENDVLRDQNDTIGKIVWDDENSMFTIELSVPNVQDSLQHFVNLEYPKVKMPLNFISDKFEVTGNIYEGEFLR